ncbi:MAG: penicillin-binding protein, partial [Candidatus Competibacteraceae bacterium]|nr:penicillin-binding protein [Candidatus Competibacteraceae bacterium]
PDSAPGAVPGTGATPAASAPAEAQQPEITEAPLVPLENATPRAQPLPPVTYDEEPEATSPEVAPVPQPGVVITTPPPPQPQPQPQPQPGIVVTTPVQRGAVVPAPVPARGNVPFFVETRP